MSTEDNTSPAVATPLSDEAIQARCAFYDALAKAQGAFKPIVKNRTVSMDVQNKKTGNYYTVNFKYADMQEIDEKTRPALAANGLSISNVLVDVEGGAILTMNLVHSAGHRIGSEAFIMRGDDLKQFGGRISYMRRYLKQALLDVAADDDLDEDGQGGGDPGTGNAAPPPMPARKTAPAPKAPPKAPPPAKAPPPPAPSPASVVDAVNAELGIIDSMEPTGGMVDDDFVDEDARRSGQAADPLPDGSPVADAAPAAPPTDPDRQGQVCTEGERNFLLKRAQRSQNPRAHMRASLDKLGYTDIDETTLEGITNPMWQKIKAEV